MLSCDCRQDTGFRDDGWPVVGQCMTEDHRLLLKCEEKWNIKYVKAIYRNVHNTYSIAGNYFLTQYFFILELKCLNKSKVIKCHDHHILYSGAFANTIISYFKSKVRLRWKETQKLTLAALLWTTNLELLTWILILKEKKWGHMSNHTRIPILYILFVHVHFINKYPLDTLCAIFKRYVCIRNAI